MAYITAPNEYRSLFFEARVPCACSGDMYSAVPMMPPVTVSLPAAKDLCHSEVGQLDLIVLIDQQVGRFEIAMHDPRVVRGFQCRANLDGVVDRTVPREFVSLARSRW